MENIKKIIEGLLSDNEKMWEESVGCDPELIGYINGYNDALVALMNELEIEHDGAYYNYA